MATPGTYDFDLYQGDTGEFTLTFSRKQSDGTRVPVDFTGATGKAQIRRTARDVNALAEFEVTFPDPEAGKVKMVLSSTDSNSIGATDCVYDLQITQSDGRVRTWIKGQIKITRQVTRP